MPGALLLLSSNHILRLFCRCLKFSDDAVRQGAARCLRDVARQSPSLAATVVHAPGLLDSLASFAASSPSVQALPALLAFGFAAEHSAELAAHVAAAPGVMPALVAALQCGDESAQAAAAWALGRIGGHGASLAQAAAAGLPRLSALAASAPEGSDLQAKCLKAASTIIPQLADLGSLAALVQDAALLPALQELALARCAAIMAKAPASRALFVTSGALGYLESQAEALPPGCPAAEQIAACLRLFPQASQGGDGSLPGSCNGGALDLFKVVPCKVVNMPSLLIGPASFPGRSLAGAAPALLRLACRQAAGVPQLQPTALRRDSRRARTT